jgi:hypothetical protein
MHKLKMTTVMNIEETPKNHTALNTITTKSKQTLNFMKKKKRG